MELKERTNADDLGRYDGYSTVPMFGRTLALLKPSAYDEADKVVVG